jgi:hypothetical protein
VVHPPDSLQFQKVQRVVFLMLLELPAGICEYTVFAFFICLGQNGTQASDCWILVWAGSRNEVVGAMFLGVVHNGLGA